MSLEETREGEVAVAEKPKTTRKRAVKKAEATPETGETTPKPKATRARKSATKTTEETPELPGLESTAAPTASEDTTSEEKPKKVVRRRTKASPETAPSALGESDTPTAPQKDASTPPQPPIVESAPSISDSEKTTEAQATTPSPVAVAEAAPTGVAVAAPPVAQSQVSEAPPVGFTPQSGENGVFAEAPTPENSEGDFYGGESSYRSGRMSYRERRMLRRQERQGQGQGQNRRFEAEGDAAASTPVENGFSAQPQPQLPPPAIVSSPLAPQFGGPQNSAGGQGEVGFPPAQNFPATQGFSQPGGFPQGEGRSFENREGRPFEPREGRFEGRRESRWERRERERRERMEARQNGEFGGDRPFQPRRREYDFSTLSSFGREELNAAATEYGLELEGAPEDDAAFVMAILEAQAAAQNATLKTGILEIINDSKAYLRCDGYLPGEADVYVSNTQIKRSGLKPGDLVMGPARAPKDNERYYGLLKVETVNGLPVEAMRLRKDFEKLTPIFPDERYTCETEQRNITARIIDLIAPIGKGQRGLIVAPPKAGKTTLIKNIANSIMHNYPEAKLFVLLIDERPEEVTDISRSVRGEVIASTFDETPDNHMRVAEIVMERAKRLAEMKQDVVILLDSITRLSRASNLVVSPSGRTLSGGLDPAAMYKPKRMFGAARNIEEGGSLTILATALVDTGSRMDEMIFEEFKGTGNMDLVLDRSLFDQRIFPAIDINRSGTRRDDLLMSGDELTATYHLRRTLAQLDNDKAVTLLIDRLKNTKSNGHFMEVVAKSARQQQNGGS